MPRKPPVTTNLCKNVVSLTPNLTRQLSVTRRHADQRLGHSRRGEAKYNPKHRKGGRVRSIVDIAARRQAHKIRVTSTLNSRS